MKINEKSIKIKITKKSLKKSPKNQWKIINISFDKKNHSKNHLKINKKSLKNQYISFL